ncbi:hypothetical protein [Streptomyces bohaiensis]|uniref:hypothetical protein n=1 Tax=Streptomyces bohaiensis TaxID=1431344 RepID=UPI0028B087DE|nr:hypothetical protein [Streptomyces bohaiensis]
MVHSAFRAPATGEPGAAPAPEHEFDRDAALVPRGDGGFDATISADGPSSEPSTAAT